MTFSPGFTPYTLRREHVGVDFAIDPHVDEAVSGH
jgi:hypothetical protein